MEKKKFSFPKSIVFLGRIYNLEKIGAKGHKVAVYSCEEAPVHLTISEDHFRFHENIGTIERRSI